MEKCKELEPGRGVQGKRARMLLRVSSEQQLEADGDLKVQRQIVLEYIKSRPDWVLDEVEYFEGGVSGYKNSVADRNELQRAWRDAQKGEYDILVVYKDDRLGRKALEIPDYIVKLQKAGVVVESVKDGRLTPEQNDPMGVVTLVLKYAVAEKSSADTGMRVKDTAKKLIQSGKFMGGRPPYGYVLEHSGEISKHGRALKRLVIHPGQADAVRHIYELSLRKEYGSAKIAGTLNTDERYRGLAPNDVWKSGTVTSILTNPVYAGYMAYNRREKLHGRRRSLDGEEWVLSREANPEIAIIEETVWLEVQRKREMRRNKYGGSHIKRNDGMLTLVDVLHCGYCGCKMVNGSKYNYWTIKGTGERRASRIGIYKCQNAWQGVPHDKTKQFRADELEPVVHEAVAECIGKLQETESIQAAAAAYRGAKRRRMEKELEMAGKELEKIRRGIRVMESHIPDAMTGEYPLTLEKLAHCIALQREEEQKIKSAVQEKEAILQDPPVPSGKIPTWRELFLRSDTASKRALIHQLIERIDVTREKMVIRFRIGLGGYLPKP